MRFNCDVDNIHIEIEAIKRGPSPRNPKKLLLIDIQIKATKGDIEMNFVSSGHHLSKKDSRLEKDLPIQVENNELIEHVLHHFKLNESDTGPEWKA